MNFKVKEQLISVIYRILSTWPFLLVTAIVLFIIGRNSDLSFSSAVIAFLAATCGLAWASAPLAKQREQKARGARKKPKLKNEKVIWSQLVESIPDPVLLLAHVTNCSSQTSRQKQSLM